MVYELYKDKFIYCKKCSYELGKVKTENCLDKYGEVNPMKNKRIQEKSFETNVKKYGHKHSSQNKDI